MAGKPTKAELYAKISPEELSKLSDATIRKYVRTMRSSFIRRSASIKKQGFYSFAAMKLENEFKQLAKRKNKGILPEGYKFRQSRENLKDMDRMRLMVEFYRYAEFFNSKTSQVSGIKKIELEQDKRLFGVDENGNATRRMTADERRLYWDVYNEFKKQVPGFKQLYNSEQVQEVFGDFVSLEGEYDKELSDMIIGGKSLIEVLEKAKEKLDKLKAEEEYGYLGPGVFTGRRRSR